MLKIKDDVDLKELEKFGFKYKESTNEWFNNDFWYFGDVYIRYNRTIETLNYEGDVSELYYLIDKLIQAGLVEKVEE